MAMKHGSLQRFTLRNPTYDFQNHLHGMVVFPTYSQGDMHELVSATSGATTFTTPRLPDDDPNSAHVPVPGIDICEHCEEVEVRALFGSRNGQKYQLGWAKNILVCRCCALCRLISAGAYLEDGSGPATPTDLNTCFVILTSVPTTLPLGRGRARHFQILALFVEAFTAVVVAKCHVRVLGGGAGKLAKLPLYGGRLVDHHSASIAIASQWLSTCNNDHECLKVHAWDQNLKLLVLDVSRYCLVELPPESRYVALSYVWPTSDAEGVQLRKNDIKHLKMPGSIRKLTSTLPKVIQMLARSFQC